MSDGNLPTDGVSRERLLVICGSLWDALYELVDLNHPVDDEHRTLLRDVDAEVGLELGDLP